MDSRTSKLYKRFYGNSPHPYKIFLDEITQRLPKDAKILDAGCGHEAPVISKIADFCDIAIGADITNIHPEKSHPSIKFIISDVSKIGIIDGFLDMVISRSVMEHIKNPEETFNEINRILKPGGYFILLTPNLYDYGSLISKLIPNHFHPIIIKATEGRNEEDTFPTYYKANTKRDIIRLSFNTGFEVLTFKYLGQYPAYLTFNPFLFLLGTAYDKLLNKINALSFLHGWILSVMKKVGQSD